VSETWLIAIDDTDNADSIGTGRLARELAAHLVDADQLTEPSVTRHQLLVHPDIPYTSHNSSACIEACAPRDAGPALLERARSFLLEHQHDGANPGLCVGRPLDFSQPLIELSRRAQREVLSFEEFDDATGSFTGGLWWSGATGQGRIGACEGAALRSTGQDGRFIGLSGIRALTGTLRVGEILDRSGVTSVESVDGGALPADARVDTQDWVRPSLRDGRPVLVVREAGSCWVPVERRSKDD